MANIEGSLPMPKTDKEYKAAIDQCFAQIERMREQIARDQMEIDRLKAETRAILAELRTA